MTKFTTQDSSLVAHLLRECAKTAEQKNVGTIGIKPARAIEIARIIEGLNARLAECMEKGASCRQRIENLHATNQRIRAEYYKAFEVADAALAHAVNTLRAYTDENDDV